MTDSPQDNLPPGEVPAPTPGGEGSVPAKPKRRPRYSGKNPRRFEDKYKEHQPGKYASDVAKVVASGKTPAGMHRPILVDEILETLQLKPGMRVVDCTLGYGGHSQRILERITPGGMLLALDVDPIELPRTTARLRAAGYGEDVFMSRQGNFAGLSSTLRSLGWGMADAVLADLGVSSMQLDDPSRGFTFKVDAPLDLRLNPGRGQSAADWLNKVSVSRLEMVLVANADESQATAIARRLVARAAERPFARTTDLADTVRQLLGELHPGMDRDAMNDTVRRVFQALRIEVNDEFSALESWLRLLPDCLAPGARVAVLTFHSGEDRRVKQSFKDGLRMGLYSEVARDVLVAGPEERRANPRSAPAKLRWAVKSK